MRKFFFLYFSLAILFLMASVVWITVEFFYAPVSSSKEPINFIVPKGATATQVAEELRVQGTRYSTYYFLLLAKLFGQLNHIRAGEYQISPGATLQQLIEKLTKGQVLLHKITFPEGWTFQQFLLALESNPKLSHTLKGLSDEDIMARIGHSGEHPEGLFYPDTYFFTLNTNDTQILRTSYLLMQKKLQQAWDTRASNVPYKTKYEALIVASLIEREAALASERPVVAGVILRRLKTGMRLQIDAAVLYGVKDKNTHILTKTDLAADTPYNTYLHKNLPPTPIAMPGAASLHAALHPVDTAALYYVAKRDGGHIFSDTLQKHHGAVQAYRQHAVALPRDIGYLSLSQEKMPQCYSAELMRHAWLVWNK